MQLLNFLVSITCFFLLLFSVHLFFAKKGNKRHNILLSLLFFARFGQIFTSLLMTTGQKNGLSILFQSFTPLYFAAPAIFYLYITGFLKDEKRLQKSEWLHFIPALFALIHVIPWPGNMALDWNVIASQLSENGYLSLRAKSGLFPPSFQYVIRPLLITTYLFFCWRAIVQSKIKTKTSKDNPGRKWILFLLKVATFFQLSGLLPILLRRLDIPLYNAFFITLNCIALLVIVLYALHQPKMFYGYLLVATKWDEAKIPDRKNEASGNHTDVVQSMEMDKKISSVNKRNNLPVQQASLYAVLMREAMSSEQLYLNTDLQIIDIATKINIPVHHCSYVINKHIGKNFRDWINGYRIEHFLTHYPIHAEKMTIEAIALESGFKSLATFYNAFKKEKGMLPTIYFAQRTTT